MTLIEQLASVIGISEALELQLRSVSERRTIARGERMLGIGERCSQLCFINQGLLRGYYFQEDKEITNWFAQEGEFATCFYAFIACKPSFEHIQALEDTEITTLSYAALQELYRRFPETERLGRIITESYYIRLEERMLNLQFKTAKERYRKLLDTRPSLLQRAPLGQIAAYLGITQETLSRIRAGI